jgi:hypothetical protein
LNAADQILTDFVAFKTVSRPLPPTIDDQPSEVHIYGEPLRAGGATYMSAAIGGNAVAPQMHFSVSTF